MATYLIDFENVGSDGLCGTEELTEKDRVYIFYSSNSGRISIKMHQCICRSKAEFSYFEISAGGKNALDFQLSTFLGFLVAQNDEDRIYVISKDRGFGHVLGFWEERAREQNAECAKIIRKPSICSDDEPEISVPEISEPETVNANESAVQPEENEQINGDTVKSVIQSMDDVQSHTVLYKQLVFKLGHESGTSVFNDIGTKNAAGRQDFHKKLVAKYGQANGTVIYNKLKRLVKR